MYLHRGIALTQGFHDRRREEAAGDFPEAPTGPGGAGGSLGHFTGNDNKILQDKSVRTGG